MPRKMRSVCAIGAAVMWAAAVGCADAPDATSPDPQFAAGGVEASRWIAQVVGGTQGFDDDFGADRDVNVLGIQAKLFADGSASGTMQTSRMLVHPPDIGLGVVAKLFNLHVDVLCMEVKGNRAWVGGIVTKGEADLGLLSELIPNGIIIDATGLRGKIWLQVNEDGTVDNQIAGVADLTDCTVQDDPPIPFFNTTNGNLRIMDRR